MSGSGKSSVGARLAMQIGWKFVDLDKLILEKQSATHHEIMQRFGEEGLKALEEQYTLELDFANTVFAPGGSLVYSQLAMEKAKDESTLIYLRVPPRIIESRLGDRLHRNGIVGLEEKGLAGVMAERIPLYEGYADYVFDSEMQSVQEMAEKIITTLRSRGLDFPYAVS